jgi:hypothetical protein
MLHLCSLNEGSQEESQVQLHKRDECDIVIIYEVESNIHVSSDQWITLFSDIHTS